jgi:hypothetical protein
MIGAEERKNINMKIRKDSPFFGIKEEDIQLLMFIAQHQTLIHVGQEWRRISGKEADPDQIQRFLARVRRERALAGVGESSDELDALAEKGKTGKLRDGVIEAARQRLFEEALEKGDSATLLELYRAANEERARERELEVEKRRAAVAEENARIGWRRIELLAAGQSANRKLLRGAVVEAEVAESGSEARMLELRSVLEKEGGSAEEKLALVREALGIRPVALLKAAAET